ncbi:S-layer homology domain-containing protein [Paenibacillus chitinolyticus]|uniref:S-layer homology domain-containing protein n=1 Tax=Paenibacillus chitinolyticus TaxID=79263 RepID=UPI00365A89E5
MSNMSSRIPNHSQNPKDIQGGDKKVMKKSLSVILSTAMALSVFSSVAFAAKADDFSDLKDLDAATKAKFDSMIQAGIFDGVEEGRFGLNDKMNRAQFAKVAALIFELKSSATTSSFEDVKSSDPANGYALPYIEALRVAGLTDGKAEGKYVPAGDVTKEELATFLIRGLGKESEAKAKPGVSDKTVSDWAKGYVQLAQELKLFETPAGQPFNGTAAATRDLLVTSAYQAQQINNASKKLSLSEAKAAGVKKVSVKFNREVDTTKAQLTLKKGTATVATEVKWADDKKSAELTLTDAKITQGSYSVTLGGVDSSSIDKGTAEFTAENETVKKVEFANTSDTLAKSANVVVKVVATNQYDEPASFSAGNYNVITTTGVYKKLTQAADGSLRLYLDTTVNGLQSNISLIPVNIYFTDTRVGNQKTFKLGTEPFVTKTELGTVKYSSGKDALINKDDTATFDLIQYDQYGNIISVEGAELQNRIKEVNTIFQQYVEQDALTREVNDFNNDGVLEVKVKMAKNVDKTGDFTLNVYSQGSSNSIVIKVKSSKIATKIKIGDVSGDIATGEKDVYIPLIGYDENGNQLSANDLADNADRINVSVSGAKYDKKIVTSGEHKGSIRISEVDAGENSIISVSANIATANVNSFDQKTFTVRGTRYADHFKVVTDSARKAALGAETDLKLEAIDQFGKKLTELNNVTKEGKTYKYSVKVEVTNAANSGITLEEKSSRGTTGTAETHQQVTSKLYDTTDEIKVFNEGFKFKTKSNQTGTADVKVSIMKKEAGAPDSTAVEVSSMTRSLEAISSNADISYSVKPVADLYYALDSGRLTGEDDGEQKNPATSNLGRKIKVVGTSGGDTVALPSNMIEQIFAEDTKVLKAINVTGADTVTGAVYGTGYVLGNKVGTTTLSVFYRTAKGETKQETLKVNVKDTAISVASITAGESSVKKEDFSATKTVAEQMDLTVTDNYGNTYEDADVHTYKNIISVGFVITDIVDAGGNKVGGVSIDNNGKILITNDNVKSFTVQASSANNKSASTTFTVK